MSDEIKKSSTEEDNFQISIPSISLPKGGGALKGIDEKFQVNPSNGSSVFNLPLPFSKSRSGFGPALSLSYNSGSGNSPFGLGWSCDVPTIQRKTDKKLPEYKDEIESDVFLFSGAEDLVPVKGIDENVKEYRPRIEGLFARIQKIKSDDNSFYWKVTTRENVVTFFGRTNESRIYDPSDESKIFKWFPDLSFDNKGNVLQFEYVGEDIVNVPNEVHEKNRLNGLAPFTNKYLKRIKYGNKVANYPTKNDSVNPVIDSDPIYLFETVFDYDDHDDDTPLPDVRKDWSCRSDAFSNYKPGFEIRTYRLCKRILFYHNFTELSLNNILEPTLVRSINLSYKHFKKDIEFSFSEADYIFSIQQFSYKKKNDGSYDNRSLPSIDFVYNELNWNTEVINVDSENFTHSPAGISGNYQWTDFYNEGISGIFTEQSDGWYYKENLGDGNFSNAKSILTKPSLTGLSSGLLQLQDIDANGKKYITTNSDSLKGYFEQTDEGDWLPFKSFENYVNINLQDPNVKFIDLNGDGIPDLVVSEENVFTWYESLGTKGYENAMHKAKTYDEEKGPAIVFADQTQSIYLADMSGDGMTDIVRIRNGEVCYWPNLGYGKFGAKVTMYSAPIFANGHDYNPDYLFLSDVSGTGATDLLYLGNNTFKAWFNLSGNSFSDAYELQYFPSTVKPNNISVLDFLGNGTGCIVWSSPLPDSSGSPMRYVDLMGGKKPYIINSYKNNFGKVTNVEYKSSTQYYLKDKINGTPWITKLPFPVQCVSKVEIKDEITGVRFTNEYSYHHGYYDHIEREFRGFGRVEQKDTDVFDEYVSCDERQDLNQLPILTKTWFHTGAFLDKEKILTQFAAEYFQNPDEYHLPEPVLDNSWTAQEWHEALRACKGMTLRQEVFSFDGSVNELVPYSAAEHNCNIQMLQPVGNNKNAIFLVTESEAISYQYERNPDDPRIAHSLNTKIDQYGNIEESASVVYGREESNVIIEENFDSEFKVAIKDEQMKMHIIYSVNKYTNDVIDDFSYRLRMLYENITYELSTKELPPEDVTLEKVKNVFDSSADILYERELDPNENEKRKIEHVKILYLNNDTTTALSEGVIESLGLVYESYKLAFTDSLVQDLFDTKVNNTMLTDAGYKNLTLANEWWIRSGYIVYLKPPKENFYLPEKYIDPLSSKTTVEFDDEYKLVIIKTEDELENVNEITEFDFRTLSPRIMKDMNGVITENVFDILGLVVGLCIKGNKGEGDEINPDFNADPNHTEIDSFFDSPGLSAKTLLGNATTRFVYDFSRTKVLTACAASIIREQHLNKLVNGVIVKTDDSPVQTSFEYSDGFGKVVMKKVQAEPGHAKQLKDDCTIEEVNANPRWVGNGRTIFNNKGKPVKQFEPYFSATHKYEDEDELVQIGVTPVLYYDPVGRLIKTEMPDGTFSKVEFDAWHQKTYDGNDTVLMSTTDKDGTIREHTKWYLDRINGDMGDEEKVAAEKSEVHYKTPAVVHLDSLGRNICSIAHNKFIESTTLTEIEEYYPSLVTFDIEGNERKLKDARKNIVMQYKYDMLGNLVYQNSMDAGQRWLLINILGNPLRTWDERNHEFQYFYDELHRPLQSKVIGGDGSAPLDNIFDRIFYGESEVNPEVNNLRGKILKHFDTGGLIDTPEYDFKGQPKFTTRKLFKNYKAVANWIDANLALDLEPDEFTFTTETDALGRITRQTAPDGSIIIPTYNETGLLNGEIVTHIDPAITTTYIKDIDYNEKGQRNKIIYGNDVITQFYYDKETFRLKRLESKKQNNEVLQDLYYTYDPVGNIIFINDDAIPISFFANSLIEPLSEYTYDALYRLTEATGRENSSALTFGDCDNWNDKPFMNAVNHGDPMAVRNYTQRYQYDPVGNITKIQHVAFEGNWTRTYEYEPNNNRLRSTHVGDIADPANYTKYSHHPQHGFLIELPHLELISWNFKEEVVLTTRQHCTDDNIPVITYYQYDGQGQRIRKITENQASGGAAPNKKEERIYISGYELYKKHSGTHAGLERVSLSLMDEGHRFVMIETRNGIDDGTEKYLARYQLHNHLGSAALELNENADVISYEEYHPFGTTAYQSKNSSIKAAAKRYRYTGMERDEETGLNYHSARYYIPWLGRWLSADPIGVKDGLNIYSYCKNTPTKYADENGQFLIIALATYSTPAHAPEHFQTEQEIMENDLDLLYHLGNVSMVANLPRLVTGLAGLARTGLRGSLPLARELLSDELKEEGMVQVATAVGGPESGALVEAVLGTGLSVRIGDVGTYRELKANEVVGDALEHDHIPAKRTQVERLRQRMKEEFGVLPTPEMEAWVEAESISIETPRGVHKEGRTWGSKNQTLYSTDAARSQTDIIEDDLAQTMEAASSQGYDVYDFYEGAENLRMLHEDELFDPVEALLSTMRDQ